MKIFLTNSIRTLGFVALLAAAAAPALAQKAGPESSKLLILVDSSASMAIQDEFNGQARWEKVNSLLQSPKVKSALKKLAGQGTEVLLYQFAEDLKKYDPKGKAAGQRTDLGLALSELWKKHGKETNLRGLVLFSDGGDNGTQFNTLDLAAKWRGVCPLHTFALGKVTTTRDQNDIFFDDDMLFTEPVSVPGRGQLTVKGVVHAPGFEGTTARAGLWLEGTDGKVKEIASKNIHLPKARANEIALTCAAPAVPGEYKVTLKIDPLQGEASAANNVISSWITVTGEGVSVLWVEGRKRSFESVFAIRHALGKNPRFSIYYAEKLKEKNPTPDQDDWFAFDKRHYDVIVIGDISASRFSGGNRAVFKKIRKLIEEGTTGLAMLGGYETFGNSDWHTEARDLVDLLPVDLFRGLGHIEGFQSVKFQPTAIGLKYLLRVGSDEKASRELWKRMDPLDGMTRLGKIKPYTEILATTDDGEPVLATITLQGGKVRSLAFGGDTTWKAWRRSKEAIFVYEHFWQQMILWLAHRDQAEGDVRITLDKRRLPAGPGNRLAITVRLRGQGGAKVEKANFSVKVIAPNKQEFDVPVSPKGLEHQGFFDKAHWPGDYVVQVSAHGKDIKGADVGTANKPKTGAARFLAYVQDVENLRPAADHEFLRRLARTGGGRFHLASEPSLVDFLAGLAKAKK